MKKCKVIIYLPATSMQAALSALWANSFNRLAWRRFLVRLSDKGHAAILIENDGVTTNYLSFFGNAGCDCPNQQANQGHFHDEATDQRIYRELIDSRRTFRHEIVLRDDIIDFAALEERIEEHLALDPNEWMIQENCSDFVLNVLQAGIKLENSPELYRTYNNELQIMSRTSIPGSFTFDNPWFIYQGLSNTYDLLVGGTDFQLAYAQGFDQVDFRSYSHILYSGVTPLVLIIFNSILVNRKHRLKLKNQVVRAANDVQATVVITGVMLITKALEGKFPTFSQYVMNALMISSMKTASSYLSFAALADVPTYFTYALSFFELAALVGHVQKESLWKLPILTPILLSVMGSCAIAVKYYFHEVQPAVTSRLDFMVFKASVFYFPSLLSVFWQIYYKRMMTPVKLKVIVRTLEERREVSDIVQPAGPTNLLTTLRRGMTNVGSFMWGVFKEVSANQALLFVGGISLYHMFSRCSESKDSDVELGLVGTTVGLAVKTYGSLAPK